MNKDKSIKTKIVHSGGESDKLTGALSPPIFQTTTYQHHAPGKHLGYEYSRAHNPTRGRLESCLAEIEFAKHAVVTASGLSSTDLVFRMFQDDPILLASDVYAGSLRLLQNTHKKAANIAPVDTTDLEKTKRSLEEHKPKLLWIETPSNPMMLVSDIAKLKKMCESVGTLLAVDNTFATPYFQNPLLLGADIVVHSLTKYIGGHSDVLGGCVLTNSDDICDKLRFLQMAVGPTLSPFDSWLVLRGVRTLALRMEACAKSAHKIAEYLEKHPKVEKVFYVGLKSNPHHELAKKQMRGFGGMLSFIPKMDLDDAEKLVSTMELFRLAESLGAVESLVCFPLKMTHVYKKDTIPETIVRLSVGIEDVDDLICDLDRALSAI